MTIEAIIAALVAGSVALIGFGLDSLIELFSATTILWLYTGVRGGSRDAERRAQQIIVGCFATLAVYLTFDAISTLVGASDAAAGPGKPDGESRNACVAGCSGRHRADAARHRRRPSDARDARVELAVFGTALTPLLGRLRASALRLDHE